RKRELLSHVAEDYVRLLQDGIELSNAMISYSSITYLPDFDVLRSYLEFRTPQSAATFAADFLFSRSSRPYALPVGAYHELVEWLRRSAGIGAISPSVLVDSDKSTAIRALASNFLNSDAASLEDADLLSKLSTQLDARIISLRRVLAFLNNDRF